MHDSVPRYNDVHCWREPLPTGHDSLKRDRVSRPSRVGPAHLTPTLKAGRRMGEEEEGEIEVSIPGQLGGSNDQG